MSTVADLLAEIAPIGALPEGGWARHGLTEVDRHLREWFERQAIARGLDVETDAAGNQWAWWVPAGVDPGEPAVVLGSHLDSVPGGGAYDGPLGICSAFAALDELRGRGVAPARPVAIANFLEEEGSRFGLACLGSRLLTGLADGEGQADRDGVTLAEAWHDFGLPGRPGPDADLVARIACYLELHIEQGVALADLDAPVGIGSGIWPHGRWRVTLLGEPNHAGTTPMRLRHDPMMDLADLIVSARRSAEDRDALATIGRVVVIPNGANAIPSKVEAWLDVRAPTEDRVHAVLTDLERFAPADESWTPDLRFDPDLAHWLAGIPDPDRPAPIIGTGAGHDAGILTLAGIPSGMLFVRNTTGVSHAPNEHADPADCDLGVEALAAVLTRMLAPGELPWTA